MRAGAAVGKVHLVEDDPVVRAMLTRLLKSGGYDVRQYSSGAEFLQISDTLSEGCILLDINMPEPDGFAVKRSLSEKGNKLPVIMMTGSGDLTVLAMRAGAFEFMQKPFGRSELLSVLAQVLPSAKEHA
jgi:two-component system response regulator FixJ